MAITFVTTTSYGTWLPGDLRGYVQRGEILPGNPRLLKSAQNSLKSELVFFSAADQQKLLATIMAAAAEFDYRLTDLAIEAWHLHWIVSHGDDSPDKMAARLKARMRQALNRGRIWTKSYCGQALHDEAALHQVRCYIVRHPGCCITDGKLLV
jgi:REP element-mobilizing transposase RayT